MDRSESERSEFPYDPPLEGGRRTPAIGQPGEGERWLRSVIENSSENVTVVDADGTLRYASPAFGRMLGYDPEEAVGTMNVLDHVHPDDLPLVLEETERALSAGGVATNRAEYRFRHKDGSWRWVESVGTYLLDDPHVGGVVVQTRDITERKEAEEALRGSEAEIFDVLESITDAFFALDREMRFKYVNAQAEVLFATRSEELIGERLWEDPTFFPEYQRAVAEGVTARFEAHYPPTGAWYSVRAYPSESGLSVYLQDITERKRTRERLREAEERYRTLVEQIPAVTYVDSADGSDEPLYTSPQIEGMLGYTPEEWLGGRLWSERLHPDDKERVLAADERFEAGAEERFGEEYRLLAKDGSVVWVREEAVLIEDEAGEPLFWQGVILDITDRKEAEEALRESEQRFRSAFDDAGIGMTIVTPDGRYMRVNRAFCGMVGYAEDELLGMTFRDITHPDDLEEDLRLGRGVLAGEDRSYSMEKRYVRKDGSVVWVHLTVSLLRGPSAEPLYSIAQAQDITGRKRTEERLKRRALHDPLTGLPNRTLFVDRLGHALERTRRRRGRKVAVLFMDLDGFKVVNDSLGHEVGDLLLTVVAQRLRRCLRPEDTLARFGGDEFVVLLEEVERPQGSILVAERIAEELRRPFAVEGRELFASASIGIAVGDVRTKTSEDLLRDADTAMYRAKDTPADFRMFDPAMYQQAKGRLELENDLRRAIERDEFVVHYQPIVDLETDEIWGVEALVRWDHPERGLLDPSRFIAVVEESGLIVPLGERVLEEACRQAKGWQDDPRIPPLVVSVNLSARQLGRPDLFGAVVDSLRKSGLDARRLSLDITETAYIRVLEDKTAALERLKDMGISISIDDFGVGYSSLSYLKRLPADALKIDLSFVRGIGEDAGDTAIVRMVIDLAHTLGMKVVAEGVEGWAQAALLREMGCDLAQGFYFARPLPPEEVSRFLAR